MKARIKGATEWKDYKEAFGQYGEFLGLETKGYTLTDEEWCKENDITYDPDCPFNEGMHYISAILPLEAFDLPNEIDWQSFRAEAAKDILCSMLIDQRISETMPYKDLVKMSLECTDELIKQIKERIKGE